MNNNTIIGDVNSYIRSKIIFVFGLAMTTAYGATNLLPGLRFEASTGISGRFVFLYSTNWNLNAREAQVYEFNPTTRALRSITTGPSGNFIVAGDGETFSILHGENTGWGIYCTNAFIYSERLHQHHDYTFQETPGQVTFGKEHVFFFFNDSQQVFDYDIAAGELRRALLPGMIPGRGSPSNATVAVAYEGHYGGFKAADGHWIFFEGRDAPYNGTRLVSSPLDEFHTRSDDPKGRNVRLLKRFPRPSAGVNELMQLSPDKQYALVRRAFPLVGHGWSYTYYAVDVLNGKTMTLFQDKVWAHDGFGMSEITWIGDEAIPD